MPDDDPELDDSELLAAEYALGSLTLDERAAVAGRRRAEPAFDQAIEEWERRLAPLILTVPSVTPPDSLYAAIARALGFSVGPTAPADPPVASPAGTGAEVIDLRRRLRRWRTTAVGLGALAATLVVAFGAHELYRPAETGRFVAVLQKDAASPAFLVDIDIASRAMIVRPIAARAPAGKSYELWLVDAAVGAPRSLGVVSEAPFTRPAALAQYDPAVIQRATYAVSVEPQGGSPTGLVTGPVVFSGKLVQAGP